MKYPESYFSASKGRHINIEDMPTPHIINAWRKAGGASVDPLVGNLTLRTFMWEELVERGCKYDHESGQWTIPPKEEAE